MLRRRREGFARLGAAHQVLWWVPAGHRSFVAEPEERLTLLREHGPTPRAFTFRDAFPAPDADVQLSDPDRTGPDLPGLRARSPDEPTTV